MTTSQADTHQDSRLIFKAISQGELIVLIRIVFMAVPMFQYSILALLDLSHFSSHRDARNVRHHNITSDPGATSDPKNFLPRLLYKDTY